MWMVEKKATNYVQSLLSKNGKKEKKKKIKMRFFTLNQKGIRIRLNPNVDIVDSRDERFNSNNNVNHQP